MPCTGLDLVRDRDVGVKIRIAGPRVAVRERGRDQAAGLDLAGAVGALAGEDRMRLEERQRIEDGSVVRLLGSRSATSGGATAHSVETDFTGVNVRSNPATASGR